MRLPIEVAAAGAFPLGFTKEDLERKFGLADATAVIRNARLRGGVERIGRGRYRSRALPEDVEGYAKAMEEVRERLLGLDFLGGQLRRLGKDIKYSYTKISNLKDGTSRIVVAV